MTPRHRAGQEVVRKAEFDGTRLLQRGQVRLAELDIDRDRERVIREGVADLRAAWAAHPDDVALAELVTELTAGSAEFAWLWEQRDVRVNGRGRKPLLHPVVGQLTVEFEVLVPLQNPDQRLIIYSAADPASQEALDRIAAAASARVVRRIGPDRSRSA